MARYRGPRLKKCRAVGVILPGLTTAAVLTRNTPPGVHGAARRSKPSDFKVRLQEKQKARWHFGLLEKQFQRYVRKASRMKGPAGQNLVILLESRLDNTIWRLGLAPTIPAARQMVVHGHVTVDGQRVDRPSFHVKPGMEISIREKSQSSKLIQENLEKAATRTRPSWIEFDPAKVTGKLVSLPEAVPAELELNLNAIIEFYSQKI